MELVHSSPGRPSLPGGDKRYRELLELVDQDVEVDVITDASAGGINAAILGAALKVGLNDLSGVRRIWVEQGSIEDLLRSVKDPRPQSLLDGEGSQIGDLSYGELFKFDSDVLARAVKGSRELHQRPCYVVGWSGALV
jgi:hypothetical protein